MGVIFVIESTFHLTGGSEESCRLWGNGNSYGYVERVRLNGGWSFPVSTPRRPGVIV